MTARAQQPADGAPQASSLAHGLARAPIHVHGLVREPIHVYFVLLPDTLVLDWAGPAEALRIANQQLRGQGLPDAFALHFIGPHEQTQGSVGPTLAKVQPLPTALPSPSWLVLLGQVGASVRLDTPAVRELLGWLRGLRLQAGALELMTVCAGSVLAAAGGLLAGRRATTHHQHLEQLAATDPRCDVLANRVFVADGPVWTSAGVTTGIDLVLHRIGQICGEAVAARVAQTLVVGLRRGPHDPELSPFLAHRNHLHAALHRVQDAVSQQPRTAWSVPAMARLAHTSPRHLARLFEEHAGIAPLAYLRRIRLHTAQAALASGHNVTQAAELAGFSSDTQLRRAWRQFGLAGSPSLTSSGGSFKTPAETRTLQKH